MGIIRDKSWKLTLIFCVIWALTLLYGEMFAYWVPFYWTCSWPHLHSSSFPSMGGDIPSNFVKVAVLTDPQIMDRTSHDFPSKSVLDMAQFYSDLYMRRAFLSTILPFEPDVILFLGDYFDGGPELSNEEWKRSLNRFTHIFDLDERGRTKGIPIHYIPGNHDIGYASHIFHKPEVLERYESNFGERNFKFTIGNVDFIAIDAQTIDGNSKDHPTTWTWEFVNGVSTDVRTKPRVLLTHIPLYRPDWTPCGPYRASELINQRITHSTYDQRILYQNYVTKESSKRLLDLIKPDLILSGHDHDQCTVDHKTNYGSVKEHTLGTLSWQQGNLFPSFILLSVANFTHTNESSSVPNTLVQLCFLPIQLFIYIWYIILFVITVISLSYGTHVVTCFWNLMRNINKVFKEGSGRKEKNEDENCEYEEVWDAEGGLHLIKKPSKAPLNSFKENNSIERGNAVIRAARKQTLQEHEGGKRGDNDEDSGSDVKNFPRSSNSLMRRMLLRFIQVFVMLLMIAIVNVLLYLKLLIKDWFE